MADFDKVMKDLKVTNFIDNTTKDINYYITDMMINLIDGRQRNDGEVQNGRVVDGPKTRQEVVYVERKGHVTKDEG